MAFQFQYALTAVQGANGEGLVYCGGDLIARCPSLREAQWYITSSAGVLK